MDVWEKPLREDHYQGRNRREKSPSFSSTLLDAIYRSIDESNGKIGGGGDDQGVIYYKETMRKKQEKGQEDREMGSLRRACMIERWMEKKVSCEKVVVRRKSMADFDRKQPRNNHHVFDNSAVLLNSSSSSSESSCGGGFSSSESDSIYGSKTRSSSCYSIPRPKPIRTSISAWPADHESYERSQVTEASHHGNYHQHHQRNYVSSSQKPKSEGGFIKTKSKALKIYSDLKKVKQPISPGGRLASFLNSLFTAGNAKKAKISSTLYEERKLKPKPEPQSTCSSASSFSRSCLSKTPSSRGKLSNNGTKRSVRFYPVSVIVDEDSRPCGHKNLSENEQNYVRSSSSISSHPTNDELQYHIMSESQRVPEAARELLKNYQKKKEEFDHMRDNICNDNEEFDDDEDDVDDDDAASYASSDLFELDNLSAIGIERYREELPVYETTYLDTNRAIASGLIL